MKIYIEILQIILIYLIWIIIWCRLKMYFSWMRLLIICHPPHFLVAAAKAAKAAKTAKTAKAAKTGRGILYYFYLKRWFPWMLIVYV